MASVFSVVARRSPYRVFAAGVAAVLAVATADAALQSTEVAAQLLRHVLAVGIAATATHLLLTRITGKRQVVDTLVITAAIVATVAQPAATWGGALWAAAAAAMAVAAKHWPLYKAAPWANPAAVGLAGISLLVLALGGTADFSASWWGAAFGGGWSLLLIVPVGAYAAWRLRRWGVAAGALPALLLGALLAGWGWDGVKFLISDSTTWYWMLIMLIDPKTSPAKPAWQAAYGAVAGALYILFSALGTPVFALLAIIGANILAMLLKTPVGQRLQHFIIRQ